MFGTSHVSLCLYFAVRCCARQKHYELIRRRRGLNKLGTVLLKDCRYFQSFPTYTTMRDYNNGTVKNGTIPEQNDADDNNNNNHVCNGR